MNTIASQSAARVRISAVTVAAVVAYALGGLWYSPVLFESVWMAQHGYTPAQTDALLAALTPYGFIATFAAYYVLCLASAALFRRLGVVGWKSGAVHGLALFAGYAAPLGLVLNLFSTDALGAWLIDAAFHAVLLAVVGAILGGWRR